MAVDRAYEGLPVHRKELSPYTLLVLELLCSGMALIIAHAHLVVFKSMF